MLARRAALIVALCLCACSADKKTQIVISVNTDLAIPGELDEVGFRARYRDAPDYAVDITWNVDRNRPDAIELPARIAVSRGVTELSRVVEYEVIALLAGKAVVSRRAALPFARDRQLLLRMNLIRRCVPVRCQPDESCGEGGCEKVDKRPEDLPDYTPPKEKALQDVGVFDSFGSEGGADMPVGDMPDAGDGLRDGSRDSDGDVGPALDSSVDGPPGGDGTVDGSSGTDTYSTVGTQLVSNLNQPITGAVGTSLVNFNVAVDPTSGAAWAILFDGTAGISLVELSNNSWTSRPALALNLTNLQDGDATITSDGAMHVVYRSGSSAPVYRHRPAGGAWSSATPIPFGITGGPTYRNLRIAPVWSSGRVVVGLGAIVSGVKRVYHINRQAGGSGAFGTPQDVVVNHIDDLALAANGFDSVSVARTVGSFQIVARALDGSTGFSSTTATSFSGASAVGLTLDTFNAVVYGLNSLGHITEDYYGMHPIFQSCPATPFNTQTGVSGSLSAALLYGRPVVAWQVRNGQTQTVKTAWETIASGLAQNDHDSALGTFFGQSRTRIAADSARGRAFIVYEWIFGASASLRGQRLVVQ